MVIPHHKHKSTLMKKKLIILPVILTFLSLLYSEEICNLFYEGDIGELKDSTIIVSEKAVALSEIIGVDPIMDTPIVTMPIPSVFFLVDLSGKMCYAYPDSNPDYPLDQWGRRFSIVYDFIDTLKTQIPYAEVGIAFFREYLYFDPVDNPDFVQCPGNDTGAYLPFFKLDSSYAPDGKPGWQIIMELLETDTVTVAGDPHKPAGLSDDFQYAALKYKPSNYNYNKPSSNINVAFDAVKHALKFIQYQNRRHYIILITEGRADVANGPHTDPRDFIKGDSVPATFTIFFDDSLNPPQDLIDMNTNIKNNGYSSTNPKSRLLSIELGEEDIMKFLITTIGSIIFVPPPPRFYKPVDITINGNPYVSNWDSITQIFTFNNHFPLAGITTNFDYKINYRTIKDSITPQGDTIVIMLDTADSGEFEIVIQDGADLPDHYPNDFSLNCWDRSLGFYYKNALVTPINMGMDTLEIRFTEEEVDLLYGYDSISVTITNSKGNIDSETFNLSKTDSCFTKLFTIAIDSTPTQNDGILQLFDRDTITVVFRNPKLPLDTLELSVPFYPTTAINPNSYINQKILSLNIINSSILFNLPNSGNTILQIYNLNGRLISTLIDSYKKAGSYKVNWDSRRFGAGVYYVRLSINNNNLVRKVVFLK